MITLHNLVMTGPKVTIYKSPGELEHRIGVTVQNHNIYMRGLYMWKMLGTVNTLND